MYSANYRSREEEKEEVQIRESSSVDSGIENAINEPTESEKKDAARKYLENALGDILGEVLTECALKRPDDPVIFTADAFER